MPLLAPVMRMERGFLTPAYIAQNRRSMANRDYSGLSWALLHASLA
jgi:hypothetical protein